MTNYEDRIGKITIAQTGPGATQGIGKIIGYAKHPTFTIERPDGSHFSWAAHLCKDVDQDCEMCLGNGFVLPDPRGDFIHDLTPIGCPKCKKG